MDQRDVFDREKMLTVVVIARQEVIPDSGTALAEWVGLCLATGHPFERLIDRNQCVIDGVVRGGQQEYAPGRMIREKCGKQGADGRSLAGARRSP